MPSAEKDAIVMHAAVLDTPFGATLCGELDGWRAQILSDVNCPDCLADPRIIPPGGGKTDA